MAPTPPSKGLADVVAASTALSDIDGKAGRLFYRGYDIHDLTGKISFEDDSVNYDVFIGKLLDDAAKWGNGHQSVADPIAHSSRPGGEEAGRPGRLSGRFNCERMTTNADK